MVIIASILPTPARQSARQACFFLLALMAAALSACTAGAPVPDPRASPSGRDYADPGHGFRIAVPDGVTLRRGFAGSYLENGQWKAYAGPDSRGESLVALQLPGSDRIAMGELRIGASSDAAEVRRCARPPDAAAGPAEPVSVGGVDYARFTAQDAAMSHYLAVEGYRAVRGGRCYAVDLLVYGTNPQVYSPPAVAPFTVEQGMARLRELMGGLHLD